MGDFDKYGSKVGREQGAERFFCKEDGVMNFNDQDFTGSRLRVMLLGLDTITNYTNDGSVLATSLISPAYGYALFSAPTGVSLASILVPAAVAGATLILNFSQLLTDGNISLLAASGGGSASVNGIAGDDLSSFDISAAGFLKMVCETAGLWQVVESNDSITNHTS